MIEVLASGAFFVVNKLVYLAALLMFVCTYVLRLLWSIFHRKLITPTTQQNTVNVVHNENIEPSQHKEHSSMNDPIGEMLASFKPGQIRVIPLEDIGQLTLNIYQHEGRAKRSLVIFNKQLSDRIGYTSVKLPDLLSPVSLSENNVATFMYEKSLVDVQDYLNNALAGKVMEPAMKPNAEPKITAIKSVEPTQRVPEVISVVQEQEKVAPIIVRDASKKSNNKTTWIGRFVGSGMGTRNKTGQKGKVETYEQYFVDIIDEAIDGPNRVWGTDLSRCVESLQPKLNQLMLITLHGKTPVILPTGEKTSRINYEITFL